MNAVISLTLENGRITVVFLNKGIEKTLIEPVGTEDPIALANRFQALSKRIRDDIAR